MNEKIKRANERKRNLIEKINLAQRHKKEVVDKTNALNAIYSQREITFEEYEKRVKDIFGERHPKKWIEYYDNYAKICQSEIEGIDKGIKKENIKKISYFAIPILLFVFIILFYQFSNRTITGSTVEKFKEVYGENIGKEFISSEVYGFNVKQAGGLDYLKASGEIVGEGNVKVYLQGDRKEFLILDSNDLEFEKVILTGGVVTGFGTEGAESGARDSGGSASSAGNEAGTVSENVGAGGSIQEGTGVTTGTETRTGIEATTPGESQNAGAETTNETTVNNAGNENSANETEVSGNASQIGNESQGNEEAVSSEKIKMFKDYCKETCDLTVYNLSENSYNLRIEVSGDAKLKLDKIRYEIEFKKDILGENLTNVSTSELNLTNVTIPELNLSNMAEKPILLKEIPNIEIKVNGSYNLTLSDYFSNAEEYEIDESENISFNVINETLEILPEIDFIGNRTGKIKAKNEFGENESNEFNISVVNIVASENISVNVTTLQYRAVINRPTKWLKILNTSSVGDEELRFELPKEASNISVKTGDEVGQALKERKNYEDLVKDTDKQELISGGITGNVALDLQGGGKGIITRAWKWFIGSFGRGITGNVILEEALQGQITQTNDSQVVDVANIVNQTNTNEVAVEYYTEGPSATEENLANGKRVLVSGKDELNYTDILAFSGVPETRKVGEESKIKVYWREQKEFVNFSAYDLDGNGMIDYVEWIVPHLSNQTYDIILITKAEHLASNRSFISDIYEQVKALDGNWSEAINDGEYVRVTFEIPLDRTRDITVYARSINNSGSIEVYEFNDTRAITTFPLIENESYYKIYLTNLSNESNYSQGTFDLKILNGSLEFDHIIDPNITFNGSSIDISIAALDNRTFVFATASENNITFRVYDTNGTNLTGLIGVPAVATGAGSRVSVGAINSTTFVVAWFNAVSTVQDTTYSVFTRTGTKITGPTDLDITAGTVGDPARPIVMSNATDSFMQICHTDAVDLDADVNIVPINTWGAGISSPDTGASGSMFPQDISQNLISCAALNSTLFVYAFFDDVANRATFVRMSTNGSANSVISTTNADTAVGEKAQVALTSINNTYFAMSWYDTLLGHINMTIRDRDNNQIGTTILVDENASGGGSDPRLAMATVRESAPSEAYNWFIVAWNDRNAGNINASVYNATGTLKYNYILATDENTTSLLFDIYGRTDFSNFGTCDGTFLFAYTNDTGGTLARTFYINGTEWNGICGGVADTTVPSINITYPLNKSLFFNATQTINYTVSDNNLQACWYTNSSGRVNNTITCGNNLTNYKWLEGINNVTIYANDSAGNVNYSSVSFTVDLNIPYTVLNAPANASAFLIDVFNITLNSTIFDLDNDTINVFIYGTNSTTSSANMYKNGLLYQKTGVANGTQVTYNWTSPILVGGYGAGNAYESLYHLDNNSIYGENNSKVYDFSTLTNPSNLTAIGNAFPNMTGGKFGGAWQFDGNGDYLNSTRQGALSDDNNFATLIAWVNRAGNSSNGYETIIQQESSTTNGYSLTASCNNSLLQFTARDSSIIGKITTPNSILNDSQWHMVVGSYNNGNGLISLYVDGVLKNSTTAFPVITASGKPLQIGGNSAGTVCDASSNAGSFNGSIDEVLVFGDEPFNNAANINDLYRLKKGNYNWKVNVTDSPGGNNESETRTFAVSTSYVSVSSSINCTDLLTEATTYYYGYSCTASGYSTCVGLNADLNISSSGVLNVPGSCNIQFNQSSNGQYNFIIEGTGKLNLTGGNITSTNVSRKFNFKPSINLPMISGNSGNFSFANFSGSVNISDSRINFYNLTISGRTIILNSTDIALGTYNISSGGRFDRQWRLNVSVYASGAVVSGANVTARNVSLTIIDSKLTGSNGAAWLNLSEYVDTGSGKIGQNNYTLNVTSGGYVPSSTTINLTSDSSTSVTLTTYSTIQVSGTETLHDIFTRVNDPIVFNNLSSASRPCRYASTASINITTGNLVMESCTLEMNSSAITTYKLEVGGGRLTANYSNITRFGTDNYDFYTASSNATQVILKNSFVSYAGRSDSPNLRGLTLNTNNVTFINNTLASSSKANLDLEANNLIIEKSVFLGQGVTLYNIFVGANDSLIIDSNLSNAITKDIRFSIGTNLTLLNTNHSTEFIQTGGKLIKQWYVDVFVQNNSGSVIGGANVSFYNVTGALTHNILTNSSGNIDRQNIIEYVALSTGRVYQTNYTINVSKEGFVTQTQSLNLTSSTNLTFTLMNI